MTSPNPSPQPEQPEHRWPDRPELQQLQQLLVFLRGGSFHMPRADRWRHNTAPIEVEPGYSMGEARMTVLIYADPQHPGRHTNTLHQRYPDTPDLLASLVELIAQHSAVQP